jgi:hypothetical protein
MDVHFYMTYYIGVALGLGDFNSGLSYNGKPFSNAYAVAWANQYTDVNSATSPWGYDARLKYHFRGDDGSGIAAGGIDGSDPVLLGIGLHAMQDHYSHAGYGPRLGHIPFHEPDYAYKDVPKALDMAKTTYGMLSKWMVDSQGLPPNRSWPDIEKRLRTLLSLPGSEAERS